MVVRETPDWDEQVDVVIVGSGGAGCAAALAASAEGADTLVLEKAPKIGGTSAISGGGLWIPNHERVIESVGETDDETLYEYLRKNVGPHVPEELIEAFLETGPSAVNFIESETDLEFQFVVHPEYHLDMEGAEPKGRMIEPVLYDASGLGEKLENVRQSPIFPLPTPLKEVMDSGGYAHFANEVDSSALGERFANQQVALGRALIVGMYEACLQKGVEFRTESPARELVVEDCDRVIGLVADVEGEEMAIGADAVVIAAGGMEWDQEMCQNFLRGPMTAPASPPYNEGDGIKMGMEIGAQLGNMQEAWWYPTTHIPGEEWEDGSPVYRLPVAERTLPGSIMVNKHGKRFLNEAGDYDDIGKALHNFDPDSFDHPNIPSYIIFDASYRERYPVTVWTIGPEDPDPEWATSADSIAELAREIDLDPDTVEETVDRFNEHAREHEDPDHGRGESQYDRTFGDQRSDHPNLGPVDEPPFYAIRVYPGCLGTKGGLFTTADAQVKHASGSPIPGLYAASNSTAHVMGIGYVGGGATLGPNVVFGYIAGGEAARASR